MDLLLVGVILPLPVERFDKLHLLSLFLPCFQPYKELKLCHDNDKPHCNNDRDWRQEWSWPCHRVLMFRTQQNHRAHKL